MKENEDYALVLNQILTRDNVNIANVIGTERFTLLNIILNEDVQLTKQSKILISKESEEVKKVNNRLSYNDLSNEEKKELENAVHSIIIRNEDRYVDFFNMQSKEKNQLHFLEGISRKTGSKILDEKENGDFKSFEDIEKRVGFIDDCENLIAKRVLYELIELPQKKNKTSYLFVNAKYKTSKKTPEYDSFKEDDSFFIEKLKKEGVLKQLGKKIN